MENFPLKYNDLVFAYILITLEDFVHNIITDYL